MLLTEMWKVLTLICELSFLSFLCTNKSPVWNIWNTHLRKNCYLCISVSLKYSTFHWPRDTVLLCAAETTCEGGSTTHSIPSPLYCSFPPSLFLLFAGVISLYWVTRFPRVTEGTRYSPLDFFTSWTKWIFLWYRAKTASRHSHLPLIKNWN